MLKFNYIIFRFVRDMKIVYVTLSFDITSKKVGGGEISNREIFKELSNKENVFVISLMGGAGWNDRYYNITCFDISSLLNKFFLSNRISKVIGFLLFKYFVWRLLRKIQPEFVIGATKSIGIVESFCRNRNTKSGVIIRAYENFHIKNDLRAMIKKIILGDFSKKTVNKMDFIITNSKFMEKECRKLTTVERIHIFYPTINIKQRNIEVLNKINTIGMVSNRVEKGYNIFLKVRKKFPNINFMVLGANNDYRDKENNIDFFKWTSMPEMILEKMDLILVPSIIDETFGRVSVEALRLGKRVLVSNRGGLPETVDFNEKLIVKSGNHENWIKSVNYYVSNPNCYNDDLKYIAQKSECFSVDIQINDLLIFLNEVK